MFLFGLVGGYVFCAGMSGSATLQTSAPSAPAAAVRAAAKTAAVTVSATPVSGRQMPVSGRQMPSLQHQKTFIINNSSNLSKDIKMAILSIVMMEVGAHVATDVGVAAKEVNIDLDEVERCNEEVITHIYNIICAHREQLNQPSSVSSRQGVKA
jgi:hypothetical protein